MVIGQLLDWIRDTDGDAEVATAKSDLGGNDVVTAPHYQGAGVDSRPLPGDYVLLVPGPEAGTFVVAGYLDPLNAGTAEAGEVRLYARDENGDIICSIRLTNGGDVHLAADTAEELMARADRVEAELDKIKEAFNEHTHPYLPPAAQYAAPANTLTLGPAEDPLGATPIQYTPDEVGCDRVYGV